MATVVLVGSLDTKGREYGFVKDCIVELGLTPFIVDFGILGTPVFEPDISAEEVAEAGGRKLAELRFDHEGSETRAVALNVMVNGLKKILSKLVKEDKCDAVFGLGGSGGSFVISKTMQSVPFGIPKLLLSTMASGDVSAYIGTKDIAIMYSVTDIAGLNRISRPILRNAAFGIAGMAKSSQIKNELNKPLVAITMNGITTPGVLRIIEQLENREFETVVFHANGSGQAMEELIYEGVIDGVIDFCVHELTDYALGGMFHAGPNRMEAAGKMGIPQVIVPGAIEVINFRQRTTVPEKYEHPDRKLIIHDPTVCAVRANKEESTQMGNILAEKLNLAVGPTSVMLPVDGLDKYEKPPDGPWIDKEKDEALFNAIEENLRDDIPLIKRSAYINDCEFADDVVEEFIGLWNKYQAQS